MFIFDRCLHSPAAATPVKYEHDLNDITGILTHWGRVTHICVDKLTIIGSNNGLSPGWRQAIIWSNARILFIRPFGTNLSEIALNWYIFIQENAFENVIRELATILSGPQCVNKIRNMLNYTGDPLHSRAACTQPCNVNTHSRAHCSPGARLCEQWGHGCVNNGARLCASARLCRGSPVN